MILSNEKFLELNENYNYDINKEAEEYNKSVNRTIQDIYSNKVDQEEARYEASLRLLGLSSKCLKKFNNINKLIEDKKAFTNTQRQILYLIRNWFLKTKNLSKCESDYYFSLKPEYKKKSKNLKEEILKTQAEFNECISKIK